MKIPDKLKLLVFSLFSLLTCCCTAAVQRCDKPTLEIKYDAFGMVAPNGQYVYLRVCENGILEYEDESPSTAGRKQEHSRPLTQREARSIRKLLDSESFHSLHGTYDSPRQFRDYALTIAVHAKHADGQQEFTVEGFLSGNKDDFPSALFDFLCKADDLRQGANFKAARYCKAGRPG